MGTDIAGFGAIGGGLVFVFGAGGDFDFVFDFFDAHHYCWIVCYMFMYLMVHLFRRVNFGKTRPYELEWKLEV